MRAARSFVATGSRRAALQRVDRLRVVLDGGGDVRSRSHRHQQAGREHDRHPGEQPGDGDGCSVRPSSSRSVGASCTMTCTIAPAPKPKRNAARLALNAAAPIHAPRIAGAPAMRPSSGEPRSVGWPVGERRDDGQALGRVVDGEADDEERAERERADRVGRADRDALAEVVQADADGDEQREALTAAPACAARSARRHAGSAGTRRRRRATPAPRRRTPASPPPPARSPRASRRWPGTRAARR